MDNRLVTIEFKETIKEKYFYNHYYNLSFLFLYNKNRFLTSYKIYEIQTMQGKNGKNSTSAFRRFSDFVWLREILFKYEGFIIPFLP
jgi:hypothetical protein